MNRYKNTLLLTTAALIASVGFSPAVMGASAPGPDDHDARQYHDKKHNDDHRWDNHEDQAYRMWLKEKHHKEIEFEKLNDRDQQAYWAWRHGHSDAVLKIDIH